MKKSTLITTIAMIVVVVVALSTATYAWFSSTTRTTVETTISTEAASGIVLYGGTYSNGTVTYSSSAPLSWSLPSGLYSPEAALANMLGTNNATASFTYEEFYGAKMTGEEARSERGIDEPDTTYWVAPKFVRVINNTGKDKTLTLTIYIEVTEGAEDAVYRAAAGFVTSIATSAKVMRTAYGFGELSDTTQGEGDGYYVATKDQTGATKTNDVTIDQPTISPTAAIADTGFVAASAAAQTAGLASTSKMRSITITLGDVNDKAALNLAFYAWLDGWALDDTAAGVQNLKIVYSFGAEDKVNNG